MSENVLAGSQQIEKMLHYISNDNKFFEPCCRKFFGNKITDLVLEYNKEQHKPKTYYIYIVLFTNSRVGIVLWNMDDSCKLFARYLSNKKHEDVNEKLVRRVNHYVSTHELAFRRSPADTPTEPPEPTEPATRNRTTIT